MDGPHKTDSVEGPEQTDQLAEHKLATETARWREQNSASILASSDGLGWKSMHVAGRRWLPFEHGVVPAVKDTLVSLYLDDKMVLDRQIGGSRWVQRNPERNAIQVIPRLTQADMRLHTSGDSIQIYLNEAILQQVAGDMGKGDPAHVEIRPLFGDKDASLAQLIRVVQSALALPSMVSIPHADAVAVALASHLIQFHSNRTPSAQPATNLVLGRPQLESVLCYIHSYLHQGISLMDLAAVAGLSIAQLVRQFKEATGVAPHQYIMHARVEKAKQLLERSQESLVDIAIACGFDSQSSLTRVFKRFSSVTPGAYRMANSRQFFTTGAQSFDLTGVGTESLADRNSFGLHGLGALK